MILHGDCLEQLKGLEGGSVIIVSPIRPTEYGYSFMGKAWDRAVPSVEIWQQCLRVLKPGGFMCVMSAPRSDVLSRMIVKIEDAGFRVDFTPIYWTYASGFPKAMNIGKMVDKRAGAEREVVGFGDTGRASRVQPFSQGEEGANDTRAITDPATDAAKALDGSYAGFQPKPAVEVIIVAMKPLSEKTYVDQALANGKGVTWLDDGRIPTTDTATSDRYKSPINNSQNQIYAKKGDMPAQEVAPQGRFPANILVSDDVLNDGRVIKGGKASPNSRAFGDGVTYSTYDKKAESAQMDSGSYSRYFDLDKWATTLPFLIVPKAAKSEKSKGTEGLYTWENTDLSPDLTDLNQHLKAISEDTMLLLEGSEWNTSLSGSDTTGQLSEMDKSTISTAIRLITELRTLSSLVPSNTNGHIRAALKQMTVHGLNPASVVEKLNLLSQDSTNEAMVTALCAVSVVLDKLSLISEKGKHGNTHSTVKPLKLMSYLVTLFSRPGDTVLDPFCGSGSTNVAAHKLGRETIGIEREAEYVEIAKARLSHVKPEIVQLPPEEAKAAEPPVTLDNLGDLTQISLL